MFSWIQVYNHAFFLKLRAAQITQRETWQQSKKTRLCGGKTKPSFWFLRLLYLCLSSSGEYCSGHLCRYGEHKNQWECNDAIGGVGPGNTGPSRLHTSCNPALSNGADTVQCWEGWLQVDDDRAAFTLKLLHVVNSGDCDYFPFFHFLWSPLDCKLIQLHGDDVMVI